MLQMIRGLFIGSLLALMPIAQALQSLNHVALETSAQNARMTLDFSGTVDYNLFTLTAPDRVVIDVPNTYMNTELPEPQGAIRALRQARRDGGQLRITVETRTPQQVSARLNNHTQLEIQLGTPSPSRPAAISFQDLESRDFIIAVDAGHGGVDPGAIGPTGVKEKTVALAIAKKVARKINQTPGQRAILIRDSDTFLGLRTRTDVARRYGADLFISIHADGFSNPKVSGSSVYVLSEKGASSEAARWVAERENQSDLIGGVSLEDKSKTLASVLLDLSQTAARTASYELANHITDSLKSITKLHKKRVESASFIVLKSPDIPSVLVETGFISNPETEKKLSSTAYQDKLATAVYNGIEHYLAGRPRPFMQPESAWITATEYTVRNGDSLSRIAKRYQTTVKELKKLNHLKGDAIRIGQVLVVPPYGN